MNKDPLDRFLDLVYFDQKSALLAKRTHDLEKKFKKISDDLAVLQERVDNAIRLEHNAHKEVDAKELEMQSLDQQLKEQNRRLDNSKNSKEYQSAHAEIEVLKQKQHEFEEVLIAAWNTLEKAKAAAKKIKQEAQQEKELLEEALERNKKERQENKVAIGKRAGERAPLFDVLPEEWRETYNFLASRSSDPAVPVESESCSACFNAITRAEMMRLDRRALLQCKGCRRFLYLDKKKSSD